MTTQLDKIVAEQHDGMIRYSVPSRSDPHATYVCELTSYNGNGSCPCDDFKFNFEKHLSRMVTPERALEEGLVKLRKYQRPRDALRCFHLVEAHDQFKDDVVKAFAAKERAQALGADDQGFRQA